MAATATGGTHPTGMHTCSQKYLQFIGFYIHLFNVQFLLITEPPNTSLYLFSQKAAEGARSLMKIKYFLLPFGVMNVFSLNS